jgi:hypothetical protein
VGRHRKEYDSPGWPGHEVRPYLKSNKQKHKKNCKSGRAPIFQAPGPEINLQQIQKFKKTKRRDRHLTSKTI